MPTGPEKVRLWGKSGSERRTVKSTRMTRRRHQRNRWPLVWSRWRQASI